MIRCPDPNTLRPSPTLIMDRRVHTRRLLWVDAVEKGKNDLTENFPCEPVETSIRECSGS
jgi:hypothetical protein